MIHSPQHNQTTRLAQFLRLGLALLFLAAGTPKILDPQAFVRALEGFQILPAIAVPATALILPWLEVLLAFTLLCRVWLTSTLILTNVLLSVFLGAVLSAAWRGLDVACGCFGPADSLPAHMWGYIVRDAILLLAGVLLTWLHTQQPHSTATP